MNTNGLRKRLTPHQKKKSDRNKVKWENEPEPDYSSKEPGKC